MKRLAICLVVLTALSMGQGAQAQLVLPGPSQVVPLPSPPPPPKLEVPKMPQLDAPPSYNYRPLPRNSFGDRFSKCLEDAAGAGLSPGHRGTYALRCAN
ncbi:MULTISPECIES: hypothetical protein [Bradyrhizobium]|uniref:hypothetical protein n=1 Tax=Bradyrhizobium sp. USDA 241 TaxID=3377725 RepID=UPI000558E51D|nr:hypothetical protein QIH91_26215 [Bradyrhizobium japonicum USDA 135]GLR95950.1 hypothetical protein GCM10007858_35870 [Bradyrhizobium liaoningense]